MVVVVNDSSENTPVEKRGVHDCDAELSRNECATATLFFMPQGIWIR